MHIRHLILSAVVVSAVAVAAPSYSADSIAFVNVQEIMRDSTAAKSAKEQIDAKTKTFQAEMNKKEESLRSEEQDLTKQKSVLAPDAFDKKVKDFRAEASKAQKDAQAKRYQLDDATQTSLHEIEKTVFEIVKKIATDRGYTVVLPTSELLYADTKLDITQEVLGKLNAELPKVSVKFKAAPADKSDE